MIITSNLLNNIEQSITLSNITSPFFNVEIDNNGTLSMTYNQIKNRMLNNQFGLVGRYFISSFSYDASDNEKYKVFVMSRDGYFISDSADGDLIFHQNEELPPM